MFTRKYTSLARRHYYMQAVHGALGSQETIYLQYDANVFLEFLLMVISRGADVLKIYIACIADKLSLVYAIDDPGNKNAELYYLINRKDIMLLDKITADGFILYYREYKLPVINKLFTTPTGKNNTVAISFKMAHLQQFRDEIICQHASGLRAYFCVYLEKEQSIFAARYAQMLHVEFALVRQDSFGNEDDFFIDDCGDFTSRTGHDQNKDFNNGTLCPPCGGCLENNVPEELRPADC